MILAETLPSQDSHVGRATLLHWELRMVLTVPPLQDIMHCRQNNNQALYRYAKTFSSVNDSYSQRSLVFRGRMEKSDGPTSMSSIINNSVW